MGELQDKLDANAPPIPVGRFVALLERGLLWSFGAMLVAAIAMLWNSRESQGRQEVKLEALQQELDRSNSKCTADNAALKADIQAQLDRRFRTVDENEARLIDRLDEHIAQESSSKRAVR